MSTKTYSIADAQQLLAVLRQPVCHRELREIVLAGSPGEALSGSTVRYCCAAVGIEVLADRARQDDPRCPCAQALGHHRELGGAHDAA